MHEGFESLPEWYGSKPRRPPAKVEDFQSGVKAAGLGLFHGYYDAITGLVTEPIEGGKEEGFLGVIKGAGRSYINATVKPATGILGVMAHPANGIFRSAQKMFRPQHEDVLLSPRRQLSKQAFESSTHEGRSRLLAAYKEFEAKTPERKAELKRKAEEWIRAASVEQKEAEAQAQENDDHKVLPTPQRDNEGSSTVESWYQELWQTGVASADDVVSYQPMTSRSGTRSRRRSILFS